MEEAVPTHCLATAKLLSPNVLCVRWTAHDLSNFRAPLVDRWTNFNVGFD